MMLRRLLSITLACAACNVGEPLVDVAEPGDGMIKIMCNLPPGCMPVTRGEAKQLSAIAVSLACEPACVWQTSSGDSAVCPESALDRLPQSAHCIEMKLAARESEALLQVDDVDWQDVNVPLRADKPLTLVLGRGNLQRVYLELEGPITVRMESLENFEDLRIVGRANAHGAPSVDIAARSGKELSVGSPSALFPGEIKLASGVYEDIDVNAETFTAESALLRGTRLHAEMTMLTDVTVERGLIDTEHALWSAFIATDLGMRFCGDARLITGQMARCSITPCEGTNVRLFNDSFVSGSLDGDFETSDTTLQNVQLGPVAATSIFAFNSALLEVNMCEHTEELILGDATQIKCSACDESLLDNFPVCAVNELEEKWLKNYCTAWSADDALPECPEGAQTRAPRAR